ncbi:pyridoxamine 5'-phosphate oxidase family protein [Bailinhaonella thermotolerans]|uniref:TIGR03618 family F420-dependent PPOX class oxidoreductase n=1 Tax=Bailinhaonella thermotolerans TaxID=1070861 RepID=A0A3A4B375_9ACTN|nr:TIGR03618 family F420-dependent PPOX class oxidoreductase [Bailinhaonella thermotolerans]RJL35611.1 TIGR03618 family F420-dependent PPOX class oxidoreductase [Bailinhaonella thermotolerans]
MNENQSGPAPRPLGEEELLKLLGGQRFGVLATVKRSGHPAMSTVLYRWDPDARIIRISTTAGRLKARQVRNNPHVALHVNGPDVWSFAVAEGEAEVSDAADELLAFAGEQPDPAAFLEQQAREQRVVIRIKVSRLYGTALDIS